MVKAKVTVSGSKKNKHWLLTASVDGAVVATAGAPGLARAFEILFDAVYPDYPEVGDQDEVTLDQALIAALITEGSK